MDVKDVLGIEPISDSIKSVTDASINGAATFLSLTCKPALEEFGQLLKDKVKYYRIKNLISITQKARNLIDEQALNSGSLKANPRIIASILNDGSWEDDEKIQDMWAGLFVTSCSKDENDQSNLIFINLLKQITKLQAKIIKYSSEMATKRNYSGLIGADDLIVNIDSLKTIVGTDDIELLDREINHLRSLNLFYMSGLEKKNNKIYANITPSSLMLNLYVRCQGSNLTSLEYFNLA